MTRDAIRLPVPPPALGRYAAVIVRGGVGCVSGQFPLRDGRVVHPVASDERVDLERAREACAAAADNVLAQLATATDGFERLQGVLRVDGYVLRRVGTDEVPTVLDAASARFLEVLGEERGRHARCVVPVETLPLGAVVELSVSFALVTDGT